MNPDEISQLVGSAEADQRTAFVANVAVDVAAYWSALRKAGLPAGLANELTLQAASFLWGGPGCACDDDG